MKRNVLMALAGACMAALLLGAIGCSGTPGAPQGAVPADQERTIDFAEGWAVYSEGDMVVQLESNATTGYDWSCAIEGSTVKTDLDEYLAPGEAKDADGKDAVGEGGAHVFGFKAEGAGSAVITLKYARSWEASDDDKTITIEVMVEDGQFTQVKATES